VPPEKPIVLSSPVLTLCEGSDEQNLLGELAKHLRLSAQFFDCGGKDRFRGRFAAVVDAPQWRRVRSLGVIRDAESDADATVRSIKSGLEVHGLAVPDAPMVRATAEGSPDVTFLVVPFGEEAGMLEDLVLRLFHDSPSWSCQRGFFDCLEAVGTAPRKDVSKRRVLVGLAALQTKNVALRMGEAAQMGSLDFDHPAFEELRRFLQLVCSPAASPEVAPV
jgi:hypothetical protein